MPFASLILALLTAAPAPADVTETLREVERLNSARRCANAYEELGMTGAKIRTEQIAPDMKNKKFHSSSIPGYKHDAIYIGIANHPKDGFHHWYVNVGSTHASSSGTLGERIVGNGMIFPNGVIAEIPVPKELVGRLEARAMSGRFRGKLSCLHAVCDLLEQEGVIIHDQNGTHKVRAKVVAANLLNGKVKILGKEIDPETMRLISTGEGELAHFMESAIEADQKVGRMILIYAAGGTAVAGASVGILIAPILNAKQSQRDREEQMKFRPMGSED